MARIYRTTDKIKYKIGEIEISISPLSVHDKAVLHSYLIKAQNGDAKSLLEGSAQAIKCAVKAVIGLEDPNGNKYNLEFEDNGSKYLTDECVNDLMNLQESNHLIGLCSQLVSGVPHALPNGISLIEGPKSPNE